MQWFAVMLGAVIVLFLAWSLGEHMGYFKGYEDGSLYVDDELDAMRSRKAYGSSRWIPPEEVPSYVVKSSGVSV